MLRLTGVVVVLLSFSAPARGDRPDPNVQPAVDPRAAVDKAKAYAERGYYQLAVTILNDLAVPPPPERYDVLRLAVAITAKFPGTAWLMRRYIEVPLDDPAIDPSTRAGVLVALAADELPRIGTHMPTNHPDRLSTLKADSPREHFVFARHASARGLPEGVLEPVRELVRDPAYAVDAVRTLAAWRLDQERFVDPSDRPYDTPSAPYQAHLDRTLAELQRIAASNSFAADSAAFHAELIRLQRTVMHMVMMPAVDFERAVIATVCTSGSTPDVTAKLKATLTAVHSFLGRVPDDRDEIERFLLSTRDARTTDPAVALVWMVLAEPAITDAQSWRTEVERELAAAKAAKLADDELAELTIQASLAHAEVGALMQRALERLSAAAREIRNTLDRANGERAFTDRSKLLLPAGKHGLRVSLAYCPGESAPRTMTPPAAPPAQRAHGCAGCAAGRSNGSPLVAVLLALVASMMRSRGTAAKRGTRRPVPAG